MSAERSLTNRQLLAIPRLLNSPSIEDGCKKARISRTTFYAWMREDSFRAELKRQRDEMIKDALDRLKSAISKATTELVKLTGSIKEETRRLACKDIIEYALKSIEFENIEQRLEKVEKVIFERRTYR